MSAAARSRVPLAIGAFTVLAGGLYWQTRGGSQQPRNQSSPSGDPNQKADVSGTLQSIAGTGGEKAREQGEMKHDLKDANFFTEKRDVQSKMDSAQLERGPKSQTQFIGKPDTGKQMDKRSNFSMSGDEGSPSSSGGTPKTPPEELTKSSGRTARGTNKSPPAV